MTMDIKAFDPSCAKCTETEHMSTLAVAIDGVEKSTGKVPPKEEIAAWIEGGAAAPAAAPQSGGCCCSGKC